MTTSVEQLPEVPAAVSLDPLPAGWSDEVRAVSMHQALSWYPVYRGTGVAVTESVASQALAHNRTLPAEVQTAVRLKIRTDGAGVRYAKRRDAAGCWELCFSSLDPWLSDIVEYLPADEGAPHRWLLMVADAGLSVVWTGTWDDRPAIPDLWITAPWFRNTFTA